MSFDFNALNNSRIDEPFGKIDNQQKKDTLWTNFKRLGRNTGYNQSFNTNYTVPLSKFPLLDWTTLRGGYGSTYTWTSASLLAKSLGNTIGNTSNKQLNAEMDFNKLYNKVKFLRILNSPKSASGKGGNQPTNKGGDKRIDQQGDRQGGKGRKCQRRTNIKRWFRRKQFR